MSQGSKFWFTAQLQKGNENIQIKIREKSEDSEHLLRIAHGGARLLLAEDNPINSLVAQAILQTIGLSVATAENGRVALDKIINNTYDLVLMDVQMPEMDGIEATRTIRALPGFENIPIIAMTANAFIEDREVCLSAGMNDCIVKPVTPEILYSKLLYWLSTGGQHSAQKEK